MPCLATTFCAAYCTPSILEHVASPSKMFPEGYNLLDHTFQVAFHTSASSITLQHCVVILGVAKSFLKSISALFAADWPTLISPWTNEIGGVLAAHTI